MVEWIQQGGIILMLIVACSLVGLAVVMERFATFRRFDAHSHRFIKKLYDLLTVHQLKTAEELCREANTPLARIALAGMSASDRDREDIREVLLHAGSREIPVLEARLGIISTIAYICPLLGLLGTVLGLIQSFQDFQIALDANRAGPAIMAEGIWRALTTTVAGLCVGIISTIFYTYLNSRKEQLIQELEAASFELLEIFCEKEKAL